MTKYVSESLVLHFEYFCRNWIWYEKSCFNIMDPCCSMFNPCFIFKPIYKRKHGSLMMEHRSMCRSHLFSCKIQLLKKAFVLKKMNLLCFSPLRPGAGHLKALCRTFQAPNGQVIYLLRTIRNTLQHRQVPVSPMLKP